MFVFNLEEIFKEISRAIKLKKTFVEVGVLHSNKYLLTELKDVGYNYQAQEITTIAVYIKIYV